MCALGERSSSRTGTQKRSPKTESKAERSDSAERIDPESSLKARREKKTSKREQPSNENRSEHEQVIQEDEQPPSIEYRHRRVETLKCAVSMSEERWPEE